MLKDNKNANVQDLCRCRLKWSDRHKGETCTLFREQRNINAVFHRTHPKHPTHPTQPLT